VPMHVAGCRHAGAPAVFPQGSPSRRFASHWPMLHQASARHCPDRQGAPGPGSPGSTWHLLVDRLQERPWESLHSKASGSHGAPRLRRLPHLPCPVLMPRHARPNAQRGPAIWQASPSCRKATHAPLTHWRVGWHDALQGAPSGESVVQTPQSELSGGKQPSPRHCAPTLHGAPSARFPGGASQSARSSASLA
jgi:hypothetical protein